MFKPPRGSGRRRVQSGRCRGGLIAEGQQGMVCLDFSRRDAAACRFEQTAVIDACDQFDCFPGFMEFAPVDPLGLVQTIDRLGQRALPQLLPLLPLLPTYSPVCRKKPWNRVFWGRMHQRAHGPQAGRHVHICICMCTFGRGQVHLQTGQGSANAAKTPLAVTSV